MNFRRISHILPDSTGNLLMPRMAYNYSILSLQSGTIHLTMNTADKRTSCVNNCKMTLLSFIEGGNTDAVS